MSSHREERIQEFERRATYSPDNVFQHHAQRWRYIPVHHFADESAAPVLRADCWCELAGDAALLECIHDRESHREVGFFARIDGHSPHWPKLHANKLYFVMLAKH
jgi:hypothetical protein